MKNLYIFLWVCSVILVSCGASGSKAFTQKSADREARKVYADANQLSAEFSPTDNSGGDGMEIPVSGRKFIKTGSVCFTAADIQHIRNHIERLVAMQQGYIADENEHNTEQRIIYDMTVKIPSDSFDSFLDTLESAVIAYDSKSIRIEDVSEEFIDTEARLRIKKQTETRYAQLLTTAKDIKDILAIQKEMDSLRADIEALEGRIRYISHEVRFSTLHISMYQTRMGITHVFFDGERFSAAFDTGISLLFEMLLALISIWPFALFGMFAGIVVFRKSRRKKCCPPVESPANQPDS